MLCDDVDGLAIDKWSRLSQRIYSDNNGVKEIDDIIAVLVFLDENLAIESCQLTSVQRMTQCLPQDGVMASYNYCWIKCIRLKTLIWI